MNIIHKEEGEKYYNFLNRVLLISKSLNEPIFMGVEGLTIVVKPDDNYSKLLNRCLLVSIRLKIKDDNSSD